VTIEFCKAAYGRPHRVHQWIDTETMEPLFGVQANVAYGKWAHVVVDNSPLLFKTKEEAKERAKALSGLEPW